MVERQNFIRLKNINITINWFPEFMNKYAFKNNEQITSLNFTLVVSQKKKKKKKKNLLIFFKKSCAQIEIRDTLFYFLAIRIELSCIS